MSLVKLPRFVCSFALAFVCCVLLHFAFLLALPTLSVVPPVLCFDNFLPSHFYLAYGGQGGAEARGLGPGFGWGTVFCVCLDSLASHYELTIDIVRSNLHKSSLYLDTK